MSGIPSFMANLLGELVFNYMSSISFNSASIKANEVERKIIATLAVQVGFQNNKIFSVLFKVYKTSFSILLL